MPAVLGAALWSALALGGCSSDDGFHVRPGLGAGQLGAPVRYDLRNHGQQLAVDDLNADGYDDVVAVHDGSGQPIYVSVFLGSATGALQKSWELGTPYFTSKDVVLGDFDRDGRPDLAVGSGDNRSSLLLFRGLGGGEYAEPLALPPLPVTPGTTDGTEGVAAADLNGDGRHDFLVAHFDPPNVTVRLSSGTGFDGPVSLGAVSSLDAALGDVDGDGVLDAVLSHVEGGAVSVRSGSGGGSFREPRLFQAGPTPVSLVLADFDGDDLLDVAVTDLSDHAVRVLINRGRAPQGSRGPR